LEGWVESQGMLKKTRYWLKLQGACLSKYENQGDTVPHKGRVTVLENREWEVNAISKGFGLKLVPSKKIKDKNEKVKEIELHFADKKTQEVWLTRLKRVCMNEATHGIEIRSIEIDNVITQAYFKKRKERESAISSIVGTAGKRKGKEKLELSVWDFAGQHDYYNNHHYFMSTRTVFMVLWKLQDWRQNMKGLEFWFRSLATHLPSLPTTIPTTDSGVNYSVFVVGTFLDHPSVHPLERIIRIEQVNELARECGLLIPSMQYFEVSCSSSLENIDNVQEAVIKAALSHSYMGKTVPTKYLAINENILQTRQEKLLRNDIPLIEIEELTAQFGDESLVKRALRLLSLWGECVYFDSPPELASMVILDPRFLAKGILADLFNHDSTTQAMRKDGIVKHADLVHIWAKFRKGKNEFESLAQTFMTLLQKLGVCFVVSEDEKKPFMEQRSIIPALLPDESLSQNLKSQSLFAQCWPKDPPVTRPIQIERIVKFSVVPGELVSRLLVQLHPYIQKSLVVKHEVVIVMEGSGENTQGWIRVEPERNRFVVMVRGSEVRYCIRLQEWIEPSEGGGWNSLFVSVKHHRRVDSITSLLWGRGCAERGVEGRGKERG